MRERAIVVAVGIALVLLWGAALAHAAVRDFEKPQSTDTKQQFTDGSVQRQDTPNDPDYDRSEPDDQDGGTDTNLFDEHYDLFGFPSQRTKTTATYHDASHGHTSGQPQVSGYNAAGAWKRERGNRHVSIAILDTGIRWDNCGVRDQVKLNQGELPPPEDAGGNPTAYDRNGNGVLDVDDYALDPRVTKDGCEGKVTGQDLIKAFSNKTDADGNGFVDDIAGWDFFDDDNDPFDQSSYAAAHNHGTGRANDAVEQGNDARGALGTCPHCQFLPIRIWDTFVSDANDFALGILYATDNGVSVIEGANGSLYHSAFAEAASQYAYDHGVAQTFSGDDLNTGNHNYPANYNHTMLIQGTVPDTMGLGKDSGGGAQFFAGLCKGATLATAECPGSNAPVQTYFRGANTTQYGGHSSVSMSGDTGSINTGRASGAVGLVISAANDPFGPGGPVTLTPDESREIVEQTAEDVTQPNTVGLGNADPAQAEWDTHFGWGRVDLGKAVQAAWDKDIPPEASIVSPDWYAPLTGDSVHLTGRLRARFAPDGNFHYKVEWGAGLAPTTWNTVKEADASGTVTDLGDVDLKAVRSALASQPPTVDSGGPVFSPTSRDPYKDQFAVKVTVTADGATLKGIDRKVLTAVPDGQGLKPGFPKRLGSGGEAPIRYADLNGDNVEELLVPTEDGLIHAYEPDGSELPGWPVHTDVQSSAADHTGAPAFASGGVPVPDEPPRGPTIADLDGDGFPEVITAAGVHLYVFESDGSTRPGWPVRNDPAFCRPEDERQQDPDDTKPQGSFHRKCGFLATPAVAHLEGQDKPLDVVAPALDGHVYGLRPDGNPVANFPVDLIDPSKAEPDRSYAESINEPAIADLNGDGKDDVVAADNEVYGGQDGGDVSFAGVLGAAAGQSTRVYAINGATGGFFPNWPISISGLIQDTLPLIGPGNDPAVVNVGGKEKILASATSGSLTAYELDPSTKVTMQQDKYGPASNATDKSPAFNLFESTAVGDLLGTGTRDVVKYQLSTGGLANLALVGQNTPYNHQEGAWDVSSGAPLPAWPTITDDYQFLSAPTIAKVVSGQTNQVLAQNGLGLLHAYDGGTGQDVAGFPKVTGGWLFAPAALSDDGRMAGITREGYLFEWGSSASACQSEWPEFRHDPHGTGDYDADGTPPNAPTKLSVHSLGGDSYNVSFVSPGDDRECGTAKEYVARADGAPVKLGDPVAGGQTFSGGATIPAGTHTLTVQARDEAGNLGAPARFDLISPSGGGTGKGEAGTGGGGLGGFGATGPFATATVTGESISPFSFRAAPSGPSARSARRVRYGARVTFTLNVAARVRFTVQRLRSGRRVRRRGRTVCVRPTSGNRSRPRCTRVARLRGSFFRTGRAGANRFRFMGRIGGRRLTPGRYRLLATPLVNGGAGRSRAARFRIVR
jgi:hypothetical protein